MTDLSTESLLRLLENCLSERQSFLDSMHHEALRLFNGFLEGCPELLVDVFASTLLLYNYAEDPGAFEPLLPAIRHFYRERLPWIRCMITKTRQSKHAAQRQGEGDGGGQPDHRITENNTWYAIDLTMNQDASFYLDTRQSASVAARKCPGVAHTQHVCLHGQPGDCCIGRRSIARHPDRPQP